MFLRSVIRTYKFNYVELECLDYSTLLPCKTGLPFDEDFS